MSRLAYWYCPFCQEEVSAVSVTYQELHDICGHTAVWVEDVDIDRLRELAEADKDGRCVVLPKEDHQPAFVKMDAVDIFDQWHDVTGALGKGTSWYYEAVSVVETVAAMAFGAGIFYESERREAAEAEQDG